MTDKTTTQPLSSSTDTSKDSILSLNNSDTDQLCDAYDDILQQGKTESCETLRFEKKLGAGGQGIVYLSHRIGVDDFALPVALKIFSPIRYDAESEYLEAMTRMATVSTKIALIQHDNLLNVSNWSQQQQIRIMEMELIDGLDLSVIIHPNTLPWLKKHCSKERFETLNNVVLDYGAKNLRIKTGAAVTIISECLKGLGALHREGIVHSDVKPSNIMIKRTGSAKIIDMGAAYLLDNLPRRRSCTPAYAPPEVLDNDEPTVLSDIASLGYVFIELLTGKSLFPKQSSHLQSKRSICYNIEQILGEPLSNNSVLVEFCKKLTAPNPADRFQSADDAVTSDSNGAAAILRQLVKMNLASEYSNDLRVLMEDLAELNIDDLYE